MLPARRYASNAGALGAVQQRHEADGRAPGCRTLWPVEAPARSLCRAFGRQRGNRSTLETVILEWDPSKAASNWRKHRVDFHEAGTVLDDPLSTTFPDPDHSLDEPRHLTIGVSVSGRILVVSHVDRRDAVRLISARRATPRERKFYEEAK